MLKFQLIVPLEVDFLFNVPLEVLFLFNVPNCKIFRKKSFQANFEIAQRSFSVFTQTTVCQIYNWESIKN
jgi:hypothetical protein